MSSFLAQSSSPRSEPPAGPVQTPALDRRINRRRRARAVLLGVLLSAATGLNSLSGQDVPAAPPAPTVPAAPTPAATDQATSDPSPDPTATNGDAVIPGSAPEDQLAPETLPADGNPPDGLPGTPRPRKAVQNPQQEFDPPIGTDGQAQETSTDTTPGTTTPKPAKPGIESQRMMVDPLAVTAIEQAGGNDDMLFTGLGGMPRPLTSPYLYSDLSTTGGFHRGEFTLNASVSTGFNYFSSSGDQPGSSTTQFYATLSPEVDLTLGEPLTGKVINFQYFGSLSLGNTDGRATPYDQSFALRGVLALSKLTLGVGLTLAEFAGGDRDFGGQDVNRELLSLALTGNYQYSEKIGLESDLTVPVRLFGAGDSSEGVTSTSFLNYDYSPLTTFGAGFAVGEVSVEHNQTQVFEQLLGRITYTNNGFLIVNGTVGVEFRDTEAKEEINPIFGIGATYQLREGTTLALTSERRVFNSAADSGDNYISTNVALTATQRLGDRWTATGSFGYENANYDDVSGRRNAAPGRNDNYIVVQGGLNAKLGSRVSASALASYGNNQSSGNAVNFVHTLVQITVAY